MLFKVGQGSPAGFGIRRLKFFKWKMSLFCCQQWSSIYQKENFRQKAFKKEARVTQSYLSSFKRTTATDQTFCHTDSIHFFCLQLFPIDPIGPKWTKKVLIPFLDREIVNSHLRLQYGRTKGKKGGSKLKGAWGGRQLFGSYDVHQISMSSHGQFQQKLFNVVLTWKDRRALGWCFPWDLRNHEFKWSAQLKANAYQTQWIIWPLQKKCFFASFNTYICAQKVLR